MEIIMLTLITARSFHRLMRCFTNLDKTENCSFERPKNIGAIKTILPQEKSRKT